MKTVSILIPNYNSFEAIQLCIESIRKHTHYPYKIIVYNDKCINGVDSVYLKDCLEKGWIHELYASNVQQTHGGSLNILINEKCKADYAAIIDCDIWIKQDGWLEGLINEAEKDPMTLAVVDFKDGGYAFDGGYRTAFYLFWFGLINMQNYNDGMKTDWLMSVEDRRKEPYRSEFAAIYPPEKNDYFMMLFNNGHLPIKAVEDWPKNRVVNDPGSQLYIKVKCDNPKGYKVAPLPPQVRQMFYHFEHISMISIPSPLHEPAVAEAREERFGMIRKELEALRNG
jgi:glycosyltransferase involved in cell wall biosynthesis